MEASVDKTTVCEHALLLPAREAAALCGTSERTWRTWDAGGRIPQAVAIGRSKFWRKKELEAWVDQGCPTRDQWNIRTTENSA